MQAVPVTEHIHWVGVIDWNLRDFHGYETPHGSTYNAYLVQGRDKIALVDTVKTAFVPELLERIRSVMPLESIDYVIVNHIEPDHNSGFRAVMEQLPNAKAFASAGGVRGIAEYHGPDLQVTPVGVDDVIDLGGLTLQFQPMPMVHWPDSMFTYCAEECCLMPNDAFGQHLATSERFADEAGLDLAIEELAIYYANILMPVGQQVAKAVATIVERGWVCDTIAPSHGVMWRKRDVPTVLGAYDRYTSGDTFDKVVIAYGTMWGSTDILAKRIADGVTQAGCEVEVFDLGVSLISTVTRHLFDARALVLGSSTLHRGMLYRPAGYLQWLSGLKPPNKLGAAFGSYGWSSGATKQMRERMTDIGFEMPFDDFTIKYAPSDDDVAAAIAWGTQIGRAVIERGTPAAGTVTEAE